MVSSNSYYLNTLNHFLSYDLNLAKIEVSKKSKQTQITEKQEVNCCQTKKVPKSPYLVEDESNDLDKLKNDKLTYLALAKFSFDLKDQRHMDTISAVYNLLITDR